ncbi:MAG: DUF5689 domain-containing protein [Bacteroidales bacterium]|nr:DUF5689 domain-containing protein [Bacteroidales bacterium]
MNSLNKILTGFSLVALVAFMGSCVKDKFDPPVEKIPTVDFVANTNIADLRAIHTATGVLDTLNTDIIIQGIVVATDESGNYYKTIVIQDTTGGIEILIDQTDIYTSFRLGQKVFIKCKGLYLGDYGGNIQLGYNYNGAIGRIPSVFVKNHLFPHELPGAVPAPKIITIPTIAFSNIATLVQFDSVYFPEAGYIFATTDASATNRIINDAFQNQLTLRTSMYANFAGSTIPSGYGSVRGILSTFNGAYQFLIRDKNDLIGFSSSIQTIILDETFASGIGGFTTFNTLGAQVWTHDASYTCMKMSGYSGSSQNNEDWLISPSINLSQNDSVYLTFDHAINYGTANISTNHTVWVSKDYTSGDPSLATWTQLTVPTYPAGNNWTFLNSGTVDFASSVWGQPNVHVAFKYLSTTSGSSTWEVKNIKIKGTEL